MENPNQTKTETEQSQNRSIKLDKCFFGQKTALKVQYNQDKNSIYIGIGKKDEADQWTWKNAKIKDTEAAEIIRVLTGKTDSTSFYHTYNDNKSQIWINRKGEQVFFKIDEFAKGLNTGEQEVLKIVLLEAIRLQIISP
ncbi:MAG: hypothetical protein DRI74_08815 [Bacteroidetes bacterium]|nr:MAG: hypothetical protein DRI74_08815 [Bacteroidota bacterium]